MIFLFSVFVEPFNLWLWILDNSFTISCLFFFFFLLLFWDFFDWNGFFLLSCYSSLLWPYWIMNLSSVRNSVVLYLRSGVSNTGRITTLLSLERSLGQACLKPRAEAPEIRSDDFSDRRKALGSGFKNCLFCKHPHPSTTRENQTNPLLNLYAYRHIISFKISAVY